MTTQEIRQWLKVLSNREKVAIATQDFEDQIRTRSVMHALILDLEEAVTGRPYTPLVPTIVATPARPSLSVVQCHEQMA